MATPSLRSALAPSAWADPTVQDEFRAWSRALATAGVDLPAPELEASARRVARTYTRARNRGVGFATPYADCCGTGQSWRMFSAPHRYPSRLHIDVLRGEKWQPLYAARSPELDWLRDRLDHVRMRSLAFRYAWRHQRRGYTAFVAWLAAQAARDEPRATHLRVRYYKARSATPAELREGIEPTGRFVRSRISTLPETADDS